VKRLEKSLLEEATDLFDKDNNHDEADCNGDLVNIKDVLLSLAHQATCNCACSSTLEDIVNMKLNMEILRSRVDALQSLANANEVCPSVDLYLNEIDKLEQEILNEKRKTNRLEVELVSFKKQISEQGYKQNNVDCVVIEGNFTAEEIPKEPDNGESYLLNDSCTTVCIKKT
jgi:predicted RNase H-like nuclease (RuvC/YqgF family)